MKILFFGAGPLGSVYAHLLHQSGADVTVLDRGERYRWLKEHGVVVVNEITSQQASSRVNVINQLGPDDAYDWVIVLIRKNKLNPVIETLASVPGVKNILFMGNNVEGFDSYLERLPVEKVVFGFPGAGGGITDQTVHFADRERPNAKRKAVIIGEIDGRLKDRTRAITSVFESAGVPVEISTEIDGWLKYHVALVLPLVGALYKHDCDCLRAANDRETLRAIVRAAKEAGKVVKALGFIKSKPINLKLFYWLPEFLSMTGVKKLLESKFANIAFAMHAHAAHDEMAELARNFKALAMETRVATPNLDGLMEFALLPADPESVQ